MFRDTYKYLDEIYKIVEVTIIYSIPDKQDESESELTCGKPGRGAV